MKSFKTNRRLHYYYTVACYSIEINSFVGNLRIIIIISWSLVMGDHAIDLLSPAHRSCLIRTNIWIRLTIDQWNQELININRMTSNGMLSVEKIQIIHKYQSTIVDSCWLSFGNCEEKKVICLWSILSKHFRLSIIVKTFHF